MGTRIAGLFELKANGTTLSAMGTFTFNLGQPKREGVRDSRSTVGYTEMPQTPYLEGAITDYSDLYVKEDILNATDATVTLKAGNGKTYMLENAWYAGDGDIDMEKGEVQVRFEGLDAEEMG